jgi:hypothetical protein
MKISQMKFITRARNQFMIAKATLLAAVLIVFLCAAAQAQTGIFTDTLQWNVSSIKKTDTNEIIDVKTIFITYGTDKVEWIQNDNIKKSLIITGYQIDWNELTDDGHAEFTISNEFLNGKIIFTRSNGKIAVEFSFTKNGNIVLPYRFEIGSIN